MDDAMEVRSLFRTYTVRIVDDAVSALVGSADTKRMFVVCDARVAELWEGYLRPLLLSGEHLLVTPAEESKTVAKSMELIETLVNAGIRRNDLIVAIGGGIVQDVTAFAASVLYRGLEWIFLPTTLIAQADSCIGSKTSINLGDKKNLVGNFWPPSQVFIDTRFLETLPAAEVQSGIGEMLHFYLYDDSVMTKPLITAMPDSLRDRHLLAPYIAESLRIKRDVVERDEFDRHERHKFNYGHTFGHALETVTDFAIPHGLAVTVGMDIANYISMRCGLMPREVFDDVHLLLAANMPARTWEDAYFERYCAALARDKKNLGSTVGCILATRPGGLVAQQLALDEQFRGFLRDYFSGPWWRT